MRLLIIIFLSLNLFAAITHIIMRYMMCSNIKIEFCNGRVYGCNEVIYCLYIIQNVPGTKESGVGYYYDNKTRLMKRVLFYRLSQGNPRESKKALDFYIEGKVFLLLKFQVNGRLIPKMAGLSWMTLVDW